MGRGAETGKCVLFTRLGNLCREYSLTQLQNGTLQLTRIPVARPGQSGPFSLFLPS